MVLANVSALIEKLNPYAQACLETAKQLAATNQNTKVSISHLMYQLMQGKSNDISQLLKRQGISSNDFTQALELEISHMEQNECGEPVLAKSLMDVLQEAWITASIEHKTQEIRSGFIFIAFLSNLKKTHLFTTKHLFKKVNLATLAQDIEFLITKPNSKLLIHPTRNQNKASDKTVKIFKTQFNHC